MFNLPKDTILGNLKIEQTFEFFDIPRLFLCKNNSGAHFLSLSTYDDYEKYEWLYLPISLDRLSSVCSNRITLWNAFKNPEDGYLYKVVSSFEGESVVEYLLPEQVEQDDLPEKEVYLDAQEKVSVGLGAIDALEAASSSKRETINIHLSPSASLATELDVKELGSFLLSFQELSDALGQSLNGEPTIKGPIPVDIRESATFQVTQIFEGSFGLQVKSKHINDLLGNSLASSILDSLIRLLESRDNQEKLNEILHTLKGRVTSKYRKLLKELSKLDSPLKVEWGSPKKNEAKVLSITKDELRNAFDLVSKIDIDMSESVTFKAKLLGLDTKTKRYRVHHLADNEDYTGKVSEDCMSQVEHSEISAVYMATLKKIIETNSSSGEEDIKWVLIKLSGAI